MIAHQVQQPGVVEGFAVATGGWQQVKSRLWARTSLRRASPMRTMASMWAPTPSFIMAPLPLPGAGARWKKFLSRASLTDDRYGLDPQGPTP